jgi:plastocyanin
VTGALLALACGAAEAASPAARSLPGRALFVGPPLRLPPPLVSDETCRRLHPRGFPDDRLVIGDGGALANVFVWVKTGLPAGAMWPEPAGPTPRLVQDGCRFRPRVLGARAGQAVEIVNADPLLHSVHALAKRGRGFNAAMPPRERPWSIERIFTKPEVMVRVRCDVHPWMAAWIGVLDHPFFAVTGPDGTFSLPLPPPGRYVLGAWHEVLGELEREIAVDGKAGGAPVVFRFRANAAP